MADEKLYGRRVRVLVSAPSSANYHEFTTTDLEINGGEGGAADPGLRVTFKIELSDKKEPNTSEIVIYNLNKDSRALCQAKHAKVTLEAGYEASGLSLLARGDLRIGDSKREGADWVTTLKIGDGERAYRNARVKQTFAAGTTGGDVLRYLAGQSGLQQGNIPDVLADLIKTYDSGYALSGKWSEEMDRFCKGIGFRWWTQNQTLYVALPDAPLHDPLNKGKPLVSTEIPEISVDSGLIGSPEFGTPEKKGKPALLKFTALLRPVTIGALVHLKSAFHDGDVRVKKASFVGDTHGLDWYVNYEGVLSQ